jgi:hypothetical protein
VLEVFASAQGDKHDGVCGNCLHPSGVREEHFLNVSAYPFVTSCRTEWHAVTKKNDSGGVGCSKQELCSVWRLQVERVEVCEQLQFFITAKIRGVAACWMFFAAHADTKFY